MHLWLMAVVPWRQRMVPLQLALWPLPQVQWGRLWVCMHVQHQIMGWLLVLALSRMLRRQQRPRLLVCLNLVLAQLLEKAVTKLKSRLGHLLRKDVLSTWRRVLL